MAKKKATTTKSEAKFDPAEVARLRMALDVLEADVRLLHDKLLAAQAWQDVHMDYHFGVRPWWRFWR